MCKYQHKCSLTRWEEFFHNVYVYVYVYVFVYVYTTHHDIHFKYFTILCQLYFNKAEKWKRDKVFPRQKLKVLITIKPALQKKFKGVLQIEIKHTKQQHESINPIGKCKNIEKYKKCRTMMVVFKLLLTLV